MATLLAGATAAGLEIARADNASPRLKATATQPAHPILIRNEHGSLLRIEIDVPARQEVRATAFSFSLAGTDDLTDLDALALYACGDKLEFSPARPLGPAVSPGSTLTIRAELPLVTGKNVVWLSCRLTASASLAHRVAAVCTSIETTAGTLTPRDASPGSRLRTGVALRKHGDDDVHTYRIPALATTPGHTLLCVYDMRRRMGRDLQEDIDIGLSRSTDGGQSWQPPRVIMDMGEYGGLPQEQNGCSDPGILVDHATGEIFCFAVWMNGKPGKHQWKGDGSEAGYEIGKSAQFLMVRSRDDGLSWSQPENLTRRLKRESWWLLAPSPQQGINLADGTLVMPIQGRDDHGQTFATVMSRRNHGASWTVGEPATSDGNECQAAVLSDGSIMLNIRNDRERFRAVYVTSDLGHTWREHETSRRGLIEPNCNASLLAVDAQLAGAKRHVLLFSNPHTQKGRTQQTIQSSLDDGRTWPTSRHHLLDEGLGAGYPSLTRIDDDHVGIVYEGSQAHLVFQRFTIAELCAPAAEGK